MEDKQVKKIYFYMIAIFTLSIFLLPHISLAQQTLLGANGNGSPINPGAIIQINQLNGIGTFIGDPVTPGGLSGIDFDSGGRLFGTTVGGQDSSSSLVQIDPLTGALINTIGVIMVAGNPIKIGDLAFQPRTDVLFGISANNGPPPNDDAGGGLYTIDTTNGIATFVGTVIDRACGLGFAPDGRLYCWEEDLHRLSPSTGQIISTIETNSDFIDSLAVRADGTIFGSLCGGCDNPDDILTVDPITGDVEFIGSTGQGSVSDLAFVPLPPTIVPTLSEWGLIAMAGVLGIIGLIAIRRRKAVI
jgi:IPTL-CTERM motif